MSAGKVALNYLILRLIFSIILSPTLLIFLMAVSMTFQGAGKNDYSKRPKRLTQEQQEKVFKIYCETNQCLEKHRQAFRKYGLSFDPHSLDDGRATP
jgi:hypothetical protein